MSEQSFVNSAINTVTKKTFLKILYDQVTLKFGKNAKIKVAVWVLVTLALLVIMLTVAVTLFINA